MKNVLVTGGAGFIGSHLCELLVSAGMSVRILDNLSTGKHENLAAIADKVKLLTGSVTDFSTCLQACDDIDTVFHLAAVVAIAQAQEDPHGSLSTNITGTQNILEAARVKGVNKVIFASSAAVYGDHEGACSENIPPQPISVYGQAKWLGEQLCQLYAQQYGLKTICVRYFNVYGPRQDSQGGVLAVLRHKLQHNQPISIFGDGTQTRDFISVFQVVKATYAVAILPDRAFTGQVFNIATGSSARLNDKLSELLQEYPNYAHTISYLPPRPGDIKHSAADCSKLKDVYEI